MATCTDPRAAATRAAAEDLAHAARALGSGDGPGEADTGGLLLCVASTRFAEGAGLLPRGSLDGVLAQPGATRRDWSAALRRGWSALAEAGAAPDFTWQPGVPPRRDAAPDPTLTRRRRDALHRLARHDWLRIDPILIGSLVEQALEPGERRRLGAHFTPRPFIERLVRPAVLEPLREDWRRAQAEAQGALAAGGAAGRARATALLGAFHDQLCAVRVLDPACGAGNILAVTFDLLADLEAEVLAELNALPADGADGAGADGAGAPAARLHPRQMLGIDKNPHAIEVARLVLWMGLVQRRAPAAGRGATPCAWTADHLACRDAVLAEDGAGPAAWPDADFVVSNPPFLGNKRMRAALGDAYTDALRRAWPDVPDSVDLVMLWWHRAAQLTRQGRLRRFGLITTNSLFQVSNRTVVQPHLDAGLSLTYAVTDHPWVERGAAVRIAMTVVGRAGQPRLAEVRRGGADPLAVKVVERPVRRIHADGTAGADLSTLTPLQANAGLCFMGVTPVGTGFSMPLAEAEALGFDPEALPSALRPYTNARGLLQGGEPRVLIDFFGLQEGEARAAWPRLFERVERLVLPARRRNKRRAYRERWWQLGEPRPALRAALHGLRRQIVTPITSKHRLFAWAPPDLLPDCQLHSIAADEPWVLGVLSSRVHGVFARATASRMGVGHDWRWRSGPCFDPFPFPDLDGAPGLRDRIGDLAEQLDAHRGGVQALGTVAGRRAHLTNQYNALTRAREARTGGPGLTARERVFHEEAQTERLLGHHDALDAAVAEAYGWAPALPEEELLTRLVALNRARAAEEREGRVRALRPER